MKIKEIIGDNYFGNWANTRTACRAIIIREGEILLSYETKTDQWMLPGGGLEPGEKEVGMEPSWLPLGKNNGCILQTQ